MRAGGGEMLGAAGQRGAGGCDTGRGREKAEQTRVRALAAAAARALAWWWGGDVAECTTHCKGSSAVEAALCLLAQAVGEAAVRAAGHSTPSNSSFYFCLVIFLTIGNSYFFH